MSDVRNVAAPAATPTRTVYVLVRLHGPLADRAQSRAVRVAVPDGAPLASVWSALADVVGDVESIRPRCALARNNHWATDGDLIADGDEIDVIPPVSGG